MITCKGRKGIPMMMNLPTYLRFYQNTRGLQLSPERADDEAAKQGIVIDHSGDAAQKKYASKPAEFAKHAA